ncbi:MAG TPA: hypothetical protein VMF08_22150 [Candidatus Sulfotelmatobacter sp.]|nr:hypothetical protein [Candidatus Sulfotelmatobacter sp.]
MDYSYSHRHYLLPEGCKDLIDTIHMPREINVDIVRREDGIIFKFKLADLRGADADIIFEGNYLRVIQKPPDENRRDRVLFVPPGHNVRKALTTYTEDEVLVFVPRC